MTNARIAEILLLPLAALMAPGAASAADGPALTAHVNGVRSDKAASKALEIADLAIRVRVRGALAETELTARFANPSRDILEGDFALQLPKGSVVTGYALDINGALVDGVLESRYKAQEAYQSRVAVRVDPGLAEVDYSDRFATRVFPIVPGAGRTIRLRFVTPLDPADGYRLPLAIAGTVGQLALTIETGGMAAEPRIGLPAGVDARFADGRLAFTGQAVKLGGALTIAMPAAGPLTVSEHPGEGRFFELSEGLPALPPSGAPARTLHVFWDRSVSRLDDELEAERALLGDLLRARRVHTVDVTLFDSAAPETQRGLTPAAALALIAAQRYRGGTSLAGLTGVEVATATPCVVFSDGRTTIDKAPRVPFPCAVRAVTSGPESDRAALAEMTGNAPVELNRANHAAALAQLLGAGSPVVRLVDDTGAPVDHVQLDAAPGAWRIVGRMPDAGGLRVELSNGERREYRAAATAVPVFVGPGALWAARQLATIGDDAGPEERIAFARRYAVASPQAAFVVLETPEDYARSDIAPPANYPKDLLPRYQAAVKTRVAERDRRQAAQAGRLRTEWAGVVRWWETRFDPQAKRPSSPASNEGGSDAGSIVVTGTAARPERRSQSDRRQAPPPPPPPPPPPMSAPPPVTMTAVATSAVSVEASGQPSLPSASVATPASKGAIAIEPWSADRLYLAKFDAAKDEYEAEIDRQRTKFGAIPLYWLDIAEWHFVHGRREEAARAALAALDLPTRDSQTVQIVAARLLRYGAHDRAIALLERLVLIETDRPQPKRTLALALLERARTRQGEARLADQKRALGLLEEVVTTAWPDQYQGIYMIALVEANRLIAALGGRGPSGTTLDPALVKPLDTGVRVSAEWNTPRTDIDLWVREPNGEEIGYSNRLSARGGRYNQDMTQGYGPEEYMLRNAGPGTYEVRAKTFAADRNNPNGPSTLTLRVFYDFGRPTEREELITVEMTPERGDMRLIGKVRID